MINHFLLILVTILTYELTKYVKIIHVLKKNFKLLNKIIQLLKYKTVSDEKKQKVLLFYAKSLFINSTKIFIIFLSILILIIIGGKVSSTFFEYLFSIFALIEITIVLLIYQKLRNKYE